MGSVTPSETFCLGIEGGATRTKALLAGPDGSVIKTLERGPANLKLMTDAQLHSLLASIASEIPAPGAVAIGLAGVWTKSDKVRLKRAASQVWPNVPCHVTNDLDVAVVAAANSRPVAGECKVLIMSGTASSAYARRQNGTQIKVGGWGHLLGDKGSGYEIGLRGLKAVCFHYDRSGIWPKLGHRLLRALQLNEPEDLIAWVQNASKTEISGLAIEVLAAWHHGDSIATDIAKAAAASLARDAATCARRLGSSCARPEFVLAGSVLTKNLPFAGLVRRNLHKLYPKCKISLLKKDSVWGAVELARNICIPNNRLVAKPSAFSKPLSAHLSPTEMRNPASMNLDRLSVEQAIDLMIREEASVGKSLVAVRPQLARAIKMIVSALKKNGRLFYAGAGTSGRLGVLDASECPPTFRVPAETVQAIIAGGQVALWKSIEGAEDDADAGARAVRFRGFGKSDVLAGIAASGTTPFVWGALGEARRIGGATILICFNPGLIIPSSMRPDIVISPSVGPEVLTGSTRLKAGTATKLILNLFTTIAMVRLGKTISNLMVDLAPLNAKLKDRATRIVQELTDCGYETAKTYLVQNRWIISRAIARLRKKRPRRRREVFRPGTRR